MTSWRSIFAERLKTARRNNNLSQKDLAMLVGLSDKSISAYEKARVLPPTYLLPKFAKELNTTISFFFGDDTTIANLRQEIVQLQQQIIQINETLQKLIDKVNEVGA
jgi:transcriptional regulator with XRE-family HTH domain